MATAKEKPIGKLISSKEIERLYDFGNDLGSGTFSTVKLATRRDTGQQFAVKVIRKKDLAENREAVALEVNIHKRIDHPNIIRLFDIYETPLKIYLIMELVTGGELFDRIIDRGHFSEADASEAILSIVRAVQYIHGMGIVHRDLKPENLLMTSKADDAVIKLADFGLSSVKDARTYMTTVCGTPGYVAPEVLSSETAGGYGKEVDLWSIGVILYILLCGFPPFYHDNNALLFAAIKKGEYDFPSPYWDKISDSAKSLVRGLLTVDPKQRFTVDNVLAHPWIADKSVAPKEPLPDWVCQKLSTMTKAHRRFRRAILATVAANRFRAKEALPTSPTSATS
eukprot:TRINITY_DN2210_c0_g1_i1.p1 TRINITY_DN2210_c0_g1~~TRINITY_DN2210_c0_g1_i1.p1  ORF type:complete len:363 (+),score=39.83 TRINITY_DN2210_c0_g1_i1:75-1091(+)